MEPNGCSHPTPSRQARGRRERSGREPERGTGRPPGWRPRRPPSGTRRHRPSPPPLPQNGHSRGGGRPLEDPSAAPLGKDLRFNGSGRTGALGGPHRQLGWRPASRRRRRRWRRRLLRTQKGAAAQQRLARAAGFRRRRVRARVPCQFASSPPAPYPPPSQQWCGGRLVAVRMRRRRCHGAFPRRFGQFQRAHVKRECHGLVWRVAAPFRVREGGIVAGLVAGSGQACQNRIRCHQALWNSVRTTAYSLGPPGPLCWALEKQADNTV